MHENGTVECKECKIRFTPVSLSCHMRDRHSGIESSKSIEPTTVEKKSSGSKSEKLKSNGPKKVKGIGTCNICQHTVHSKDLGWYFD